jgi:phosphatidylglycerol---prolipoprotein diacylglyceryl transferase
VITAYPMEFELGPLTLTGFGLSMMAAFLIAAWLIDRELQRLGFNREYGGDMLTGAVVGGIIGAKLWYVGLHGLDTLWSRSGLVWYGGFVGGTIGVIVQGWRRGVPLRWTAQLVAPALAAGYVVGRIGCFLVGDDYGGPSTLPWAIAFPEGAPPSTAASLRSFGVNIPADVPDATVLAVHPTQLYEAGLMFLAFVALWRWRTAPRGTGWLFGAYLVMAGIERFVIEILRAKDDRILGPLTLAQAMSVALVVIGATLIANWLNSLHLNAGKWLTSGSR